MSDLPSYLLDLRRMEGAFPRESLETAIERRDEATPYLLESLERAARALENDHPETENEMPVYALFLLGQFRETRAFDPILRIARHPNLDALLGEDVTSGGLDRILASICGGDLERLLPLVADDEADEYARNAGLRAAAILHREGAVGRDELVGFLRDCVNRHFGDKPGFFWSEWAMLVAELSLEELMGEADRLYERGLTDEGVIPRDEIRELAASARLSEIEEKTLRYMDDTVGELENWACFGNMLPPAPPKRPEPQRAPCPSAAELPLEEPKLKSAPSHATFVRKGPKVGRNDPCPCGSGRKYKKCCGGR